MAQASPLVTVTPKQLGKHLRAVRRKKGLSLSEVARGAGLSRRELVAYERGRVPIPESDLWVIAGSCGIDVSELLRQPTTPALEPGTTSIGETVAQLRRSQDDAALAPYLSTLQKLQALPAGKRVPVKDRELESLADALGGEPATIDERLQRVMHVSPEEAARLRSMILPPVAAAIAKPRAIEAVAEPMPAPSEGAVDVFEELARLPEPLPLPDPGEPLPDLLAPPPVPNNGVELVDGLAAANVGGTVATAYSDSPRPWSGEDAPPIDIAARQADDPWGWSSTPLPTRPTGDAGDAGDGDADDAGDTGNDESWEPEPWTPPPPDGNGPAPAFWEGTDDWVPYAEPVAETPAEPLADEFIDAPAAFVDERDEPGDAVPDAFEALRDPWFDRGEPADASPSDTDDGADDAWSTFEWPRELLVDPPAETSGEVVYETIEDGTDPSVQPWEHAPDPAAVSTGFYVDWGTETDGEPAAWYAPEATDTAYEPEATATADDDFYEVATFDADTRAEPEPIPFTVDALTLTEPYDNEEDHLPPIFWRAAPELTAPDVTASDITASELTAPEFAPREAEETPQQAPHDDLIAVDEPVAEPTFAEEFVTAGPDWQLGNALPLVEVRGQGALVMRRADERWALADVTTTPNFALEVDVDFRSGPGLGVLFRASIDSEGRMSGYSFDVDPIYDGGGFLVRQWQADRELWNPIARVSTGDPTAMYGQLTIRLVVHDETLVASVNGAEVLTVENLKQASADRGRDAASGDRVGVQAWSSSDLVIDTLRVAAH